MKKIMIIRYHTTKSNPKTYPVSAPKKAAAVSLSSTMLCRSFISVVYLVLQVQIY